MTEYRLFILDTGKPAARRGRKATGPLTAGLGHGLQTIPQPGRERTAGLPKG